MSKLKIVLLVLMFFFSRESIAQFVTIPDANFVSFLQNNGFAAAMNGNQMDTTHSSITGTTSVSCSSKNIADLFGIHIETLLADKLFQIGLLPVADFGCFGVNLL